MSVGNSESLVKSRALEIFDENVSSSEVARAYLKAEFPNILGEDIQSQNGSLEESLTKLSDEQIDRLLEAVSYTYRMNGVFQAVTDKANDWIDVELPINAINLTGTKPHINDIVYSPRIRNRPIAFAEYLASYFAEHPEPDDDPKDLKEFKPRSAANRAKPVRLMVAERNNAIEIVDGTHRLLSAALIGLVSIRTYAAVPNGKESISMRGDSTFLTMRLQFEKAASDKEREDILKVCILLANSSTDGAKAIRVYWIEHSRREDIKEAGRKLLQRLNRT